MQPLAVTIPRAVEVSGLGRTTLYQLISAGKIDARKQGRRTLVIVESLSRHLDSLPKVEGRNDVLSK
jgi:hypothetical protein